MPNTSVCEEILGFIWAMLPHPNPSWLAMKEDWNGKDKDALPI